MYRINRNDRNFKLGRILSHSADTLITATMLNYADDAAPSNDFPCAADDCERSQWGRIAQDAENVAESSRLRDEMPSLINRVVGFV